MISFTHNILYSVEMGIFLASTATERANARNRERGRERERGSETHHWKNTFSISTREFKSPWIYTWIAWFSKGFLFIQSRYATALGFHVTHIRASHIRILHTIYNNIHFNNVLNFPFSWSKRLLGSSICMAQCGMRVFKRPHTETNITDISILTIFIQSVAKIPNTRNRGRKCISQCNWKF